MKAFIKKYIVFIIFLGVELYFFITNKYQETFNYELFFMGWGVVWLMFLFFSIMGSGPDGSLRGIGSSNNVDSMNYSTLSGGMAEHLFKDRESKKKSNHLTFINLVYLIMFSLNVIGYIIVFVIKY